MAKGKSYDFDFITKSFGLGLIPILDDTAAVNPGAVTDMKENARGGFTIHVHGGNSYDLDEDQMLALQQKIKTRIQQNKADGKAEYEENVEFQIVTQQKIQQKLTKNVQPTGGMIVGDGRPRNFRR